MRASNVLGIIYSNVYDSSLSELTSIRTMGSVPFSGRYRLIDFILSDMVNCGMNKVGVITKSNYQSLMDHIGSGKAWDLSRKKDGLSLLPPFGTKETGGAYKSRLEAIESNMEYILRSNKEYVLFADSNVVCNLDYSDIIEKHCESGADITIAYKRGIRPKLDGLMTFEFDGDRVIKAETANSSDCAVNYSLNILIMKRVLLERLIDTARAMGLTSFEKDLIAANVDNLNIQGYKVEEYSRTIYNLQSYYDISMDLVRGEYKKLFVKDRPIYTKVRDDVPVIYGPVANVKDSLVADGCIIKGTVENSILFRGVYIAEGVTVKNSIIMQDSYISAGCQINCAILDKEVVVKPNKELSGAETYPLYIGKGITV